MKIFDNSNGELMDVGSIERDGPVLVIKGKIFGAMPMTARVTPEEARKAFGLLDVRMVLFLLTFLFRSSRPTR